MTALGAVAVVTLTYLDTVANACNRALHEADQ